MNNKVRGTTTQGLFWRSIEGIGIQGVNFVIQLVLARILMPEDFGIIAILNIFINLANTFVQNGFSSALLRKKDAKEVDFCSVFYTAALCRFFFTETAAPETAPEACRPHR